MQRCLWNGKTMNFMWAVLLTLCVTGAAGAEELFSDDFEEGFSSDWVQVPEVAQLVPDPDDSDNTVVMLPPGQHLRHQLVGPPVRPGDWKVAADQGTALDGWRDYELTFRFRLDPVTDVTGVRGNVATFMRVGVRIDPQEETAYQMRLLYVGLWRPEMKWYYPGLYVPWYGRNERLDSVHANRGRDYAGVLGTADTQWHVLRVVNVGDRTAIWMDEHLVYDGEDSRASRGGFSIGRWNGEPHRVEMEHLYLDDVVAQTADESALSLLETVK